MAEKLAETDDRYRVILAKTVCLTCARIWNRKFFHALVKFWNENTGENWKPDLKCDLITYNHPKLLAGGLWIYERERLERDSGHQWSSRFSTDASPPVVVLDEAGNTEPVVLSDVNLASVESRAAFAWASSGRRMLMQQLAKGTITEEQAAFAASKYNWAPIPAKLTVIECELPHQEWITLSEAIVALIVGKPGEIESLQDLRLTTDAELLSATTLFDAAYKGAVHIYGQQKGNPNILRIGSHLFREVAQEAASKKDHPFGSAYPINDDPSELSEENYLNHHVRSLFEDGFFDMVDQLRSDEWRANRIGSWQEVLVKVDTLRTWVEKEIQAKSCGELPIRPRTPKERKAMENLARSFFEQRVSGWDRSGPFPTFDDDYAETEKAVGRFPRSVMRRIRTEVCNANGFDETDWLKRGPRRKLAG